MSAAQKLKEAVKFDLEIVKGPHAGLRLSFTKPSVIIGRGPENDIVLSSDPRVSRQHVEIKQRGANEFVIINLSPKNYILLNEQIVQSEVLINGSVIQIGDSEIHFKVDLPVVASSPVPAPPPAAVRELPKMQVHSPPPPPVTSQNNQPAMQPKGHGGYPPPKPGPRPASGGMLQDPKARFYGIIGLLILAGWFLFSSDKKVVKDPNAIRSESISMKDVADAEKRTQELLIMKKDKYDSVQYRRAQENFIKGFRDFQQGQYARARESFQVVLNLDPDNELAKRYYHLSKIKFDELVKFNMMQGNRYREKKNWRMCQSNYSNVMTMLHYRKDDPSYREAKQFFEECTLNLEGRY